MTRTEPNTSPEIGSPQFAEFREQGFAGPMTLMEPAEMAALRPAVDEVLATRGLAPEPSTEQSSGRLSALVAQHRSGSPVPFIECRHLDSPVVHRLCTHPRLLAVARALYGADLLLWRSTFIAKASGGPEFHWHQDWGGVHAPGDEYGLEPPMSFTFWIALTEATEENGCLRFIPGVRAVLPSRPANAGQRATMLVDDQDVDTSEVRSLPLQPGQFAVFTDRALHASGPNTSGAERLGLAVRYTVPAVRVRGHFPGHACLVASGADRAGLNVIAAPPT
ncbi:chlorinating enzyme [Amycolatopsis pretoriensis]|uniref:Chlorinating enzyme n=1 Tax=Amycolatopsis pretoriensis TaxID=218821 RepID=A0A1H5QE14_9PSEU|nr:phytanoyl-CoA dioxygenase family protein [Amycolatopsis pretoriensis]SEF23477.1 chlorinating enzyme [Amycolatopsis pretoriensis]